MSREDVAALLRQVERAGLFTHSALGRGHLRQRELESFVYGLIDVLLAHGVIEEDELRRAVQAVRDEMDASGEPPEPGVVLRVDEANVADTVPGPLLDRMELVTLDGYTEAEKVAIARDHLLPRQLERAGLTASDVTMDEAVLSRIATEYTIHTAK